MPRLLASMNSRAVPLALFIVLSIYALYLFSRAQGPSPAPVKGKQQTASRNDGSLSNIHNRTLGFQKILAVSLPSRTDHRDALALGSAFTGIKVEYVDGIKGADVDEKTLPPGGKDLNGLGNRGSWRGHLNAIHRVVEEGLGSALIMEDDIDWDLRIKDELVELAKSVHVLRDQSGSSAGKSGEDVTEHKDFVVRRDFIPPPTRSPYGDSWDVLWLGHCGTRFPEKDSDPKLPQARAILLDDITVPEPHYIYLGFGNDHIRTQYPNHTRVVHHTAENVCSLAYAVTQRAARQILWKMSLDKLTGPFDIALRNYCDNDDKVRNCWTVQPSYFNHHRAVGPVNKMSDINDHSESEEVNMKAVTDNVRWSVRMNLGQLVEEETEFEEQWPDTA